MKVTEKDVLYVAALANLELTEQERERLARDLNSILEYVGRMNELDTTNVPPMTQISDCLHTDGAQQTLRSDDVQPSLENDAALQNAPDGNAGFFRVPKVIEK